MLALNLENEDSDSIDEWKQQRLIESKQTIKQMVDRMRMAATIESLQ